MQPVTPTQHTSCEEGKVGRSDRQAEITTTKRLHGKKRGSDGHITSPGFLALERVHSVKKAAVESYHEHSLRQQNKYANAFNDLRYLRRKGYTKSCVTCPSKKTISPRNPSQLRTKFCSCRYRLRSRILEARSDVSLTNTPIFGCDGSKSTGQR